VRGPRPVEVANDLAEASQYMESFVAIEGELQNIHGLRSVELYSSTHNTTVGTSYALRNDDGG
jgi:hypothetical protein